MQINCVFIDDEPLALKLMAEYAGKINFIGNKNFFTNSTEALAFLRVNKVHAIFLDINMPDLNGLQLARNIQKECSLIFCTAYADHALEGYELEAVDYLVKPFSYERFLKAALKAQEISFLKERSQEPVGGSEQEYVFVKSEYSLVKIKTRDIILLEGLKDYVKIHIKENAKPILTLQSLKSLEEILPPARFFRVHKSYIIHLDFVGSVQRNFINIHNREIPLGSQYRDEFMKLVDKNTPR